MYDFKIAATDKATLYRDVAAALEALVASPSWFTGAVIYEPASVIEGPGARTWRARSSPETAVWARD